MVSNWTRIRAIPLDALCDRCKRGWMRRASQNSRDKKKGQFYWPCQVVCDRCGYSRRMYPKYVGVEE